MDGANLRSSTFTMGDDNLRGFRRRWVRQSQSDASEHLSQISGLLSEPSGPPEADEPGVGTDCGSWEDVGGYKVPSLHESAFDDEDQHGDSPVFEPEQFEVVQVTGDESTEFHWKCEALQSSAKRAKLYGDKLPWENAAFSGVFGEADIFAGTIVSGYKHALAPTSIGAFEVLQSETIPARQTDLPSSSSAPPVSWCSLVRVVNLQMRISEGWHLTSSGILSWGILLPRTWD